MATAVKATHPLRSERDFKKLLFEVLPQQGDWTDEEYLCLTDQTNRRVEFTDGYIEVLPMPTDRHQSIQEFLYSAFLTFITPMGGKIHSAGMRQRVRKGKFRQPDLILIKSAKDPRREDRFWKGADLTLEVVSKDKPERDLIDKRGDYAEAGVAEYWIANPQTETVTVLRLKGKKYVEHGILKRGQYATSVLLVGFSVSVDGVMDAD